MPGARIIGIVGTAKNTGKTTVLAELCKACAKRGVSLAVTSIGYDGEEFDNVTLLGKPRLDVEEGTIVVTSEQCVSVGTARLRVIARTGEHTPLGEVLICSVEQRGLVLLAGPNKTPSLETVVARMGTADLILLDGAMNRIAPMSCCAFGVIFATGAARTADIEALATEAEAIQLLFDVHDADDIIEKETITIARLVCEDDAVRAAATVGENTRAVLLPSLVTREAMDGLLGRLAQKASGMRFVFHSAIALLASCGSNDALEIVRGIEGCGGEVRYARHIALVAFTINPFYPKPVSARGDFEPAFVDKVALKDKITERVGVPVINIHDDGAAQLFDEIMTGEGGKQ